jgi:hypothetical protein
MVTSPGQANLATAIPFTYVLADPLILEACPFCLDFVGCKFVKQVIIRFIPNAVVMLAHKCN